MAKDKLTTYRAKRDFQQTQEPSGQDSVQSSNRRRFVIQKHDATRLHYDLRLELDGVFKSWAVTKGPSLDPHDKRLAVEVEDHPLDYGDFEGTIPKDQYGGGTVMLWDRGYWEPEGTRTAEQALAKGDFKFTLEGERLHGGFVLVRMANDRERGKRTNWLLIKHRDEFAVDANGAAVLEENDTSVASGRPMEVIAAGKGRKPKPFMLQGGKVQADAVWDSRSGLAAEERKAGREKKASTTAARELPDFIAPAALRDPGSASFSRRLDPRDQVRRLPHPDACRGRRGDVEDPQGSRLDRQISGHRESRRQVARRDRRWRDLRS
jgi:bifunctional non-homologous end joining protein LigD